MLTKNLNPSEDSGKFGVLFDDSVFANEFDQANDGSQACEQPKHSRAQKFLSVLSVSLTVTSIILILEVSFLQIKTGKHSSTV